MTDIEKTAGAPIDDDALDGVVGGVNILPLTDEERDRVKELLQSGEPLVPQSKPGSLSTRDLTKPAGPTVIVEPLDNEITKKADEFQQGMNLGGLSVGKKQF